MYRAQHASPPPSGHPVGMVASSPIPRQWWEQDARAAHQQSHNADGTMRSVTPAMSNKVGQLGTVSAPESRAPGPPGGSNVDQGVAAEGVDRGYYRPGAPSPIPALQQPLVNGTHDNRNPVPSYGQMQNAGTNPPPHPDLNTPPRAPSATGLIRLTLKKPMGIVFEPMTDPHNSSQQRGVRICDLPRTGAAALSRKVEVGDELLSINDKTMSRLTFDEIMDFIIEADPDQVNLLFRRPRKEQLKPGASLVGTGTASVLAAAGAGVAVNLNESIATASPGSAPAASNGNTVKWVDGKDGSGTKNPSTREEKKKGKNGSAGGKKKKPVYRDEESIATGDSSRFTSETPREPVKGKGAKKGREPYASESFLDMLIDSLCAPLVPKDVKRRRAAAHEEEYSDDDMTFNSADDSTYITNDSASLQYASPKGGKSADKKTDKVDKKVTANSAFKERGKKQEDKTIDYEIVDDDDTQGTTVSVEEATKKKSSKKKEAPVNKGKQEQKPKKKKDKTKSISSVSSSTQQLESKVIQPSANSKDHTKKNVSTKYDVEEIPNEEEMPAEGNYEDDATLETVETQERAKIDTTPSVESPPPLGLAPQNLARKKSLPLHEDLYPTKKESFKESDVSSYIPDANIPISELEYDEQLDQGDVSVLDSLGGPSLLIENHRLSQAVAAGNAAAARYSPTPTVSAELISSHGKGYPADTGFTQEETIRRDPVKFYRHVVRELLNKNEPEKVRLLDKLLAKYKGREEHLIQKLTVRYSREKKEARDSQFEPSDDNDNAKRNDDGFETFGVFPNVTSKDGTKHVFESGTWPPIGDDNNVIDEERKEAKEDDDFSQGTHSSYTESEYSGDSIDGTSPAVIAQVSELLNYVYGKTSVPGQIDRVSTIMRAYEGREAVLLELLETKALIKANADNEQSTRLPVSLRSNPAFKEQSQDDQGIEQVASPLSGLTTYSKDEIPSQEMIDDVSTISGADDFNAKPVPAHSSMTPNTKSTKETASSTSTHDSSDKPKENEKVNLDVDLSPLTDTTFDKKKKKGIFGGIFGGKKRNKAAGSFPNSDGTTPGKGRSKILSPKGKKGVLLNRAESESSI